MSELDMQRIALLIGKSDLEPSPFSEYLEQVANRRLLDYRRFLQWGGKQGESLYTHVLNGITVLETLRPHLDLTEAETRVLYVAFTVHDLNKALGQKQAFGRLATRDGVASEINRLQLDTFLPGWTDYLEDITSLVRGHSGHHHSGGERWIVKREPLYRLGLERVNALLHLMRAADGIDLSQTLDEHAHKSDFLGHLNAYLADSSQPKQYEFMTHRLTEQRGILSNVLHNAILTYLHEHYGLIPLLYYPDGVAYLVEKGRAPTLTIKDIEKMGKRAADLISNTTTQKFKEFIESTGQGIKVDPKCLELGIPFRQIWREIYNLVQRRNFDPSDVDVKVRDWAQRSFNKSQSSYPAVAERVRSALEGDALLVSADSNRLRLAELIRSYYIFLNKHFATIVPDAWEHIYRLLELSDNQWPYYAYFDPLWARAYVLSQELTLNEEEVYLRIEQDGEQLTSSGAVQDDPKIALFIFYLTLYAVFTVAEQPEVDFQTHLAHYAVNEHQQCVYCSGPFATAKWMAADVRSDITVQTFSNRLRGGPGEPKKHICAVCQIQFLLEKLNYPEVRGEKILYLHLYPYSFLTRPFIEGLNATIRRIISEDTAVQALNMNVSQAIEEYLANRIVTPTFRSRTKEDRPQPFGIYLPQYAETTGNLLIFPLNPAGDNDTERFLFALWNALLLQRHFGVKVLMSDMAVSPLDKDQIPDLYVDNIPLACEGLLPRNDYAQYRDKNGTVQPGPLETLWSEVGHLFALRRITFTSADPTARLVKSLGGNPLHIFYETEKLLEARVRSESQQPGRLFTRLAQEALPHVQSLALSKGGIFMSKLSEHLERLAEVVWQNGLRGRSLEKSSLLFALDTVLQKLNYMGGITDLDTLKAAAVQDIFDHLSRIADERYQPGRRKWEATKQFVDGWFDGVLKEVYGGNPRKLLNDEKLIRSAFHFYLREKISSKAAQEESPSEEEAA